MLDKEAGSSSDGTSTSFWNQDHKLGISTDILIQLCKVAKHAFLAAFKEYKRHENACAESLTNNISSGVSCPTLESKVMKHSQAALLLSSDFGTAWNARKLILSKQKLPLEAFTEELRLSRLILSNSPKSEPTWSHRRWIIKMISRSSSTQQEIINKESELVESIGERSKMNYRAWYHRCWLVSVSYMTIEQVIQELKKSKRWAGLHVADSSCFHYRRALWLHRRFLSLNWIMYFCRNQLSETGESIFTNEETGIFIGNEIHLLESSMTVPDNKFEDFQAQALHASVYMLWLTKLLDEEGKWEEMLAVISEEAGALATADGNQELKLKCF
uniref:Uncharacterized protein n=1 Tax=Brassica campestris TaxID=3711 RepID=M4EFI3_BRACM